MQCLHFEYMHVIYGHFIAGRGKDFRTDFKKIGGLRAFTTVPFIALTASAPPSIRASIVESLHLNNPVYVEGNLDRPNIYMSASSIKGVNVSVCVQVL